MKSEGPRSPRTLLLAGGAAAAVAVVAVVLLTRDEPPPPAPPPVVSAPAPTASEIVDAGPPPRRRPPRSDEFAVGRPEDLMCDAGAIKSCGTAEGGRIQQCIAGMKRPLRRNCLDVLTAEELAVAKCSGDDEVLAPCSPDAGGVTPPDAGEDAGKPPLQRYECTKKGRYKPDGECIAWQQ